MTKTNGTEDHGVASLHRVRAKIVAQIGQKEAEVQALVLQLSHIDATLSIMRPGIELEPPRKRPAILGPREPRQHRTRPLLEVMHCATGPMTIREIARAVLIAQGKPAQRISADTQNATRWALRKLKSKGDVRVVGKDGLTQTWELVRED